LTYCLLCAYGERGSILRRSLVVTWRLVSVAPVVHQYASCVCVVWSATHASCVVFLMVVAARSIVAEGRRVSRAALPAAITYDIRPFRRALVSPHPALPVHLPHGHRLTTMLAPLGVILGAAVLLLVALYCFSQFLFHCITQSV